MTDEIDTIPILAEAGGMGFKRYSGIVAEEFHSNLQGKDAARVYREMADNDPLIGGALRGKRALIRQAPWPVKAANDTPEAHKWAEYFEQCMYDMEVTWRSIIDEMLSMEVYGFCLMWIAYKLRRGDHLSRKFHSKHNDGLYGWRTLEIRKQDTIERWLYAEDDETLIGAQQLPPPRYKWADLPLERLIHLRYEMAAGSPEGRSGLRNCYRSYYLKTLKEEIEGTGIARDLAGYPVIRVPLEIMKSSGATTAQAGIRTLMESNVRKIKRDQLEGMVFPARETPDGKKTGYDFDLMSSGGSRQIDINGSIVRDRVDMLLSLIWEHPLLGTMQIGTQALSSDKTTLAAVNLGATMDIITETINLQAVPRLMRLNNVPANLWPELTHGDIEKESVIEWVNGVVVAANGGMIVPTDEDEKTVREKMGLEQRGPDDTILAPPQDEGDMFGLGGAGPAMPAAPAPEPQPEPEPTPEVEKDEDDLTVMTSQEAAQWLNVSHQTIMRAIREGRLPGVQLSRNQYRIQKTDLIEFMKPSTSPT